MFKNLVLALVIFFLGVFAGRHFDLQPQLSAMAASIPRERNQKTFHNNAFQFFRAAAPTLTNSSQPANTSVNKSTNNNLATALVKKNETLPAANATVVAVNPDTNLGFASVSELAAPFPEGEKVEGNTNSWGETSSSEHLPDGTSIYKLYSDKGLIKSESWMGKDGVQISKSYEASGSLHNIWQMNGDGTNRGVNFNDDGSIKSVYDDLGHGETMGYSYENGKITGVWRTHSDGSGEQVFPRK